MKTIILKIKNLLVEKNIKKCELADKLNMPKQTVYDIFSEKQRITLENYANICDVLGVRKSYFFGEEDSFGKKSKHLSQEDNSGSIQLYKEKIKELEGRLEESRRQVEYFRKLYEGSFKQE